jgi:uncharacterized heparinase superfamily protein
LIRLANYFHTLRYLRPVQVFGRIRYKLRQPRPDERTAPPLRAVAGTYASPIAAPASMLAPERFRFLNLDGNCTNSADWSGQGQAQLWAYNLHYLDDMNAADSPVRVVWHQRLVQRWIDENPPGSGIGWNPYPLSRRIVNWVKWSLRGNALTGAARQSLAVQARWLGGRIESHLQGNHVFVNAKALVHAGLYFEGKEAARWLRHGLSIMEAELAEQVLADGGHFERSPMYHAGFVEDMLDTMNVLQAYGHSVDGAWLEIMARMMKWLKAMSHPDGGIAFFNDAAFGVTPDFAQLRDYALRLNVTISSAGDEDLCLLMPSGYASVNRPPFFLVCDVAPIGPDHLPAHAHADTLSFEMSFKGRRVFVNSGTSEYGLGAERQRQRGTAAHNTLVIDGEDSSEVWSGFRVARRARARVLKATADASVISVTGEHDGYRRLRRLNLHRRSWRLTMDELLIDDIVEGEFRSAECHFHLHPGIEVRRGRGPELQLRDSRGGSLDVRFEGAAAVDVMESTWHPEFGVALPNHCIVTRLDGPRLSTRIQVSDSN